MNKKDRKQKGFSLVEFIVILSIFAIMTAVSLFNYNQHQSTLEQSNLAQEVALTIRQAQVYGISATNQIYGKKDFDASGYLGLDQGAVDVIKDQSIRGVSIDLNNKEITLYADQDKNNLFTPGNSSADRVIDKRSIISNKLEFAGLSLIDDSGSTIDKEGGFLDISFRRPYPDAIIAYRSGTQTSGAAFGFKKASLFVKDTQDPNAPQTAIVINSIGNITIEKKEHDE